MRFFRYVSSFFVGLPMFLFASFFYLIENANYYWLKSKSRTGWRLKLSEWLLPYDEERFWDARAKLPEARSGPEETARKLFERDFMETLRHLSFNSVLEVGCGNGKNLLLLNNSFQDAKVNGLDISQEMLSVAKKNLSANPKVRLLKGDAAELVFPENSFDLVFSVETLMHIPKGKVLQVIREMARVSKKYVVVFGPDIARAKFSNRVAHARHVFYHNYLNLFSRLQGLRLHNQRQIAFKEFSAYVFKKAEQL